MKEPLSLSGRSLNVRLAERLPPWDGANSITLWLLCLAVLCFPFSVAANNLFLGLALAAGILGGLWWDGVKRLWDGGSRPLFLALLAYLVLVPAGLLWSQDTQWGMHIMARHWFWLLVPVVVVALAHHRERNIFLTVASAGLAFNLFYCLLQANGLIESPTVQGSTADNATGHIGHTSFGVIYGIWIAWLIHVGIIRSGRLRWGSWLLALWGLAAVFSTEGISGYMVTVALLLVLGAKWVARLPAKQIGIYSASAIFLVLVLVGIGPGKERLSGLWQGLSQSSQVEVNQTQAMAKLSTEARLSWWKMSLEIWQANPLVGVGTGGFPKAMRDWRQQANLDEKEKIFHDHFVAHPHNQYLLNMVRWGMLGLLCTLALLFFWLRQGWCDKWTEKEMAWPLVLFSGVALALHAIPSVSLEEHFATIFAILMLSVGLAEKIDERHHTGGL